MDNKGIGIEDLVFDDASAQQVIERFKAEKVDAVMIINCNFGNEEAAADIVKALGKPVLLWAPLFGEFTVRHPENKNAELLWHYGPYIHHFVEIFGDYRKEIAEFCKYFPNLKVDKSV